MKGGREEVRQPGFVSWETTDSSYSHSVAAYPHDNPTSLHRVTLYLNNPRYLL